MLLQLTLLLQITSATDGGLYGASVELPEKTSVAAGGAVYGAVADERGPIGGGAGVAAVITGGDYKASTLDGLLEALAVAEEGEVVFLPGDAVVDCTARVLVEELVIQLPQGVTIASDRGHAGSQGALIFSDELKTRPLFQTAGADVRLSGLRLRGPDPERRLDHHRRSYSGESRERNQEYYYSLPTSDGVRAMHDRLTVVNCEFAGWSHAAVDLRRGVDHVVRHSFIHHNQRQGLGYGVCLDVASATIERNLFDWNRHSIAGTGRPGCGYIARHNVERGASLSHCFDMHGGRDRKDGTDIAGTLMVFERNTFCGSARPIKLRGVPEESAHVAGNWFHHTSPSKSVVGSERLTIGLNAYGASAPEVTEGR